mmetsp:Transcript_50645/g.88043  ORF Transcript_50645/g.88043 Transcript_50645/m.88043 type:complete len:652 (+) Transcript_50645:128-2083(+)
MKVSNSYDRAAELLLAAGPASLLSSGGGAAPPTQRKSARPDRPHSGNFQRHHTYPSAGLGGSGKTAFPPKPLPMNPTYRAACVEAQCLPSLQERLQAQQALAELAAMDQTPREQAMLHTNSSRQVAAASTAREVQARTGSRDYLEHSAREPLDLGPRTPERTPARDHDDRRSLHQRVGGCKTPDRGSVRHDERHDRHTETGRGHSGHLGNSGQGRNRSIDASTRSLPARDRASVIIERHSFQQRRGNAPVAREMSIEDDTAEYSDRFLTGYEKGRLLGKGACAVVWLAAPVGQKDVVAIKQVAKGNTGKKRSDTEAARKEIFFGSYFFHPGGEPKVSTSRYPGIEHIAKLLDYAETKRDIWLVMEYGGTCLTKMAYEIKGEFLRGERLYRVMHLPLLQAMKCDPDVLKDILRQLLSALCVLADHHIVHSDIKPDNILITNNQNAVKFCDLGTAVEITGCHVTPYLGSGYYRSPEIVLGCEWGYPVDTWALGCTLFELFTGKILMPSNSNNEHLKKIMDLKGKIPGKVIKKGMVWKNHFTDNLDFLFVDVDKNTKEEVTRTLTDLSAKRSIKDLLMERVGPEKPKSTAAEDQQYVARAVQFADLLELMLFLDPDKRIIPGDALQHQFCQDLPAQKSLGTASKGKTTGSGRAK